VLTAAGFILCTALLEAPVELLAMALVPTAALALCWNGLAVTAAAEMAPPGNSGTALGMQNTANYLSASITPALAGWVAVTLNWQAALLLAATAAITARALLRTSKTTPTKPPTSTNT
jgi:sugar phosphate permease